MDHNTSGNSATTLVSSSKRDVEGRRKAIKLLVETKSGRWGNINNIS